VPDVVIGADGLARCAWPGLAGDELYQRYHDDEWGRVVHGDRELFEKVSLEAFQSGLSWITILRKRSAFRAAFAEFDIPAVAQFDETDVERLMADAGIIRNRAKILATISNARIARELTQHDAGALDRLLWSFAPPPRTRPRRPGEFAPATTPESEAASRALKKLGFRFVGPTTFYALMQATGMVDDHAAGCYLAGATAP
jgi:DNA-3-methyladenine glycosylase I